MMVRTVHKCLKITIWCLCFAGLYFRKCEFGGVHEIISESVNFFENGKLRNCFNEIIKQLLQNFI